MIHVMLDLETWGTTPGCDIRSIGACVFQLDTGPDFCLTNTFYVACDNPPLYIGEPVGDGRDHKYPLTRNAQTVQWWSEQSDEAQAAFADPVDLREALVRFTQWITALDLQDVNNGNHGLRIWSHGASFDPPILAAAYEAVGLPVPWHYRAPRDTRTLFDVAGIDDHTAWLKQHPGPMGIPHHALDDAICQARAVCAAYERATPTPLIEGRDADVERVEKVARALYQRHPTTFYDKVDGDCEMCWLEAAERQTSEYRDAVFNARAALKALGERP